MDQLIRAIEDENDSQSQLMNSLIGLFTLNKRLAERLVFNQEQMAKITKKLDLPKRYEYPIPDSSQLMVFSTDHNGNVEMSITTLQEREAL